MCGGDYFSPALARQPTLRHILPHSLSGTSTPNIGGLGSPIGLHSQPGTPKDEDFKFRTVASLQESSVTLDNMAEHKAAPFRELLKRELRKAGIHYHSLLLRTADTIIEDATDPELLPNQVLVCLSTNDSISLDALIKAVSDILTSPEMMAENGDPVKISHSSQSWIVDWSTSNVYNLCYDPDSELPTPIAGDDDGGERQPSLHRSEIGSVSAGRPLTQLV